MDLHKIRLSSNCFTFSKIVNPVEVKPDIASKYEFINEILENVIQTIDKNDFDVWVHEFLKQQPEYIGK